ncbi:MAG: glutamate synthase subunit alpha, partial [Anaerolineae bacterium]
MSNLPLYNPRFEHDACGIGLVAYADGRPRPDVMPLALQALANLVHRGGVLADGKTSDGAGILCPLPHPFFAAELDREGIAPPPPGSLAVGQLFLPKADPALARGIALIESTLARPELGLTRLGWRDVPLNPRVLGPQAEATRPVIRQVMVAAAAALDPTAFERRLYLARRIIERDARAAGLDGLYVCSLSGRVIVYKGLLLGSDLGRFYTDLLNHRFQVGMATFHQRYSTNTFPAWQRAQPFRLLCHNGEINSIQGNVNWMRAREAHLRSAVWGDAIECLKPVIDERGSDSAMLDNVLELLTLSGRGLLHAAAMLIPEAWDMLPADTPQNRRRRDFYAYHAGLMEPWDGPAALVFCDGRTAGITLDRNGLRPIRFEQTAAGLLIAGSEAGFIELDPATVVKRGRLGPGQMLALDTATGAVLDDETIKQSLA